MPSLKDLTCSVELSDGNKPLQELGTVYNDGSVSTFIPIPKNKAQAFTVHLTSSKFIAPGLALFVFIDGVYQCNRNRQDLKLRTPLSRRSLVDFRVRQKEEKQTDGSMMAQEWTFEGLCKDFTEDTLKVHSPDDRDSIGCIEVVVLRCAGPRTEKTPPNMNLDGPSDLPDHCSSPDSRSRITSRKSTYDDRDPFAIDRAPSYYSTYRPQTIRTIEHRSVRSPRTATHDESPLESERHSSHRHSGYSISISPRKRQSSIPSPGFQYGSGPIPSRSVAESGRDIIENLTPEKAAVVDSGWLDKLVTDAVKRGVEQSRKSDVSIDKTIQAPVKLDMGSSSQPPGAWPSSPFGPAQDPAGDSWDVKSKDAWEINSKDEWDNKSGSEWDTKSRIITWDTPEDIPSDSWDTDDTWSKHPHWAPAPQREDSDSSCPWSNLEVRSRHEPRTSRRRTEDSHPRSRRGRSKSRSRGQNAWAEDPRSSSSDENDREGWTYIISPPRASSLTSTIRPSHSQSQAPRRRSRSHSHSHSRRLSTRRRDRSLSQPGHSRSRAWTAAAPAISIVTPVNAPSAVPIPRHGQKDARTVSLAPPSEPNWGYVTRPASIATKITMPGPTPYGTTLGELRSIVGAPVNDSTWLGAVEKKSRGADDGWGSGEDMKVNDGWTTDGDEEDSWGKGSAGKADGWDDNSPEKTDKDDDGWQASPASARPRIRATQSVWWDDTPKTASRPKDDRKNKHKSDHKSSQKRHERKPKPDLTIATWSFPPPPSSLHPAPSHQLNFSSPTPTTAGGTRYEHAIGRPVYLDTLAKPYAVFRFRYRGVAMLKGMFKGVQEVSGGKDGKGKRGGGKVKVGKEMMKAKENDEERVARELTEKWVLGQE